MDTPADAAVPDESAPALPQEYRDTLVGLARQWLGEYAPKPPPPPVQPLGEFAGGVLGIESALTAAGRAREEEVRLFTERLEEERSGRAAAEAALTAAEQRLAAQGLSLAERGFVERLPVDRPPAAPGTPQRVELDPRYDPAGRMRGFGLVIDDHRYELEIVRDAAEVPILLRLAKPKG